MDLDTMCRACLSKRGRMQNIFSVKIRAMIESCTAIMITEADDLPKKICDNCFRRLINSFSFNNMIQRNENILCDFLRNKDTKHVTHKQQNTSRNHDIILNSEHPPLVPIAVKMNPSDKSSSQLQLSLPVIKRQYKCRLCDKRYNNRGSLRLHLHSHTGEKPHQCSVCGKRFVRWAGVTSHMVTHSGQKAHKCSVCGRGFKVRSNMERHKVLHNSIPPYCCSFCGKTFTQSNNLTLHMQTRHTMERLYLCSICGKQFVSSSRLKRHIRIHTNTN